MLCAVIRRVDNGIVSAAVQRPVGFIGQLRIAQRQTCLQHYIAQSENVVIRHALASHASTLSLADGQQCSVAVHPLCYSMCPCSARTCARAAHAQCVYCQALRAKKRGSVCMTQLLLAVVLWACPQRTTWCVLAPKPYSLIGP